MESATVTAAILSRASFEGFCSSTPQKRSVEYTCGGSQNIAADPVISQRSSSAVRSMSTLRSWWSFSTILLRSSTWGLVPYRLVFAKSSCTAAAVVHHLESSSRPDSSSSLKTSSRQNREIAGSSKKHYIGAGHIDNEIQEASRRTGIMLCRRPRVRQKKWPLCSSSKKILRAAQRKPTAFSESVKLAKLSG